jgi:hypothetical protein
MPRLTQVWIRTRDVDGTEWIRADTMTGLYVADGNFNVLSPELDVHVHGSLHVAARFAGREKVAILADGLSGKQNAFTTLRLLLATLAKPRAEADDQMEVCISTGPIQVPACGWSQR